MVFRKKSDKPGTDWGAKKADAGSREKSGDRPQRIDASNLSTVSDDDVSSGVPDNGTNAEDD